MAVEPVTDENQPGEIGRHARDYSGFTRLLKWGAGISFVTAILILFIIS